jgi:ferredoxin
MTKLQPARAQTTEAFLAQAGPELAALCTACGACLRACPIAGQVGLAAADPEAVTGGLRQLANGQTASSQTVTWVKACTRSGLCVAACPQKDAGLNAMLLVRIAKQRAINDTRQITVKPDPTLFPRVKVFARLQLSDEELAEWL